MNASAAEQTETTPLLSSRTRNRQSSLSNRIDSLRILPYVDRFYTQGLPLNGSWYPEGLSISAGADCAAFELLVLLAYKHMLRDLRHSLEDVWEQWSEETKRAASMAELESRIVATWNTFLNVPRSCKEVEQVLWKAHQLSDGSAESIRRTLP
ncbi:uncharacterized protein PHACADRAFT_247262 [Phanerochaete carnosa HHB-10118-sp]|uniref:Uncharacterized protein n=1 Tax=Phanerochaete carnosa (strain HHB-10118-sp) TaxID=650164 RepID=K5WAM2_PHACS|nr:uncharacterized protein PHACADRAFT_247262 [Phanerochaete carnosa HHB-10118-sp]EKM60988.1 hypothetical protein PHACADRAFT_247262 [Phanerochaete carnosa HHB-10118-sp]